MGPINRRNFLRFAVAGTATIAFSESLERVAHGLPANPGASPYGPLRTPDARGLALPVGFTSRIVARSSHPVGSTSYEWHPSPDGGACFPYGTGWIYVSNCEMAAPTGGASAIRFTSAGGISSAYRILEGTRMNCSGGATPWGSWLSCEEVDRGYVYRTDPTGATSAVALPALGRFKHEAAAVDPTRRLIYLTEDEPDGRFYRFRPTTWPQLHAGTLEVLVGTVDQGAVTWARVPDPSGATTRTRYQVPGAKVFRGGEGCAYANGFCWFTTKTDNRVWRYDAVRQRLAIAYDDNLPGSPLKGVDNVARSRSGDLFVAEDGGNLELCILTPDDVVAPFLRLTGHTGSEITGPAFSPNGQRLYFSSQRGRTNVPGAGMTFEVRGPFRSAA